MNTFISSTWHEFQNLIRIHSNVWQRSHFNIIKWVFHGLLHPNHIQVLDNGIHPKEPTIHFVYRKNRQAKTIKMRRHLKWWKMNWRHNIVYIETSLHSQLESTYTLLDLHVTKKSWCMWLSVKQPQNSSIVYLFFIFFSCFFVFTKKHGVRGTWWMLNARFCQETIYYTQTAWRLLLGDINSKKMFESS